MHSDQVEASLSAGWHSLQGAARPEAKRAIRSRTVALSATQPRTAAHTSPGKAWQLERARTHQKVVEAAR